jgi:hypothetical protein
LVEIIFFRSTFGEISQETKKKKHLVKAACADHHCSLNSYGLCGEALGERKVKGDGSAVSAQPTTPFLLLLSLLSFSLHSAKLSRLA